MQPRSRELYDLLLRNHLLPFLVNRTLDAVKSDVVRAWRTHLLEAEWSVLTATERASDGQRGSIGRPTRCPPSTGALVTCQTTTKPQVWIVVLTCGFVVERVTGIEPA